MLGGVTKLHASDELTRRRWLKSFVKGTFRMGVQIITDYNDLSRRPVVCPQEVAISWAQSTFVRRLCTATYRQPTSGSQNIKMLAVPAHSYS